MGENAVRFEISMYAPQEGESIYVDNIRLSDERLSASTRYTYYNIRYMGQVKTSGYDTDFPKLDRKIKVLGTDWEFDDLTQLGDKVKDKWVMPSKRTVDDVESAFAKTFAELKKTHPGAVMTILRQGQTGYDPQHPDRAFTGWKNAFLSGHDPASVYALQLGLGTSRKTAFELNGRHRCPLLQVDLTAIPKGSRILSAQLLLVTERRGDPTKLDPKSHWYKYSPLKPTLYVAEPCNRAWDEATCNGLEYARGKFWKEPCGMYWQGDDPDFFPIVLAYGQSGLDVSTVDFTEGVKYWTDGKHENHGFTLSFVWHYYDLFKFWTRKAPNLKHRPAMMVIYEPGK